MILNLNNRFDNLKIAKINIHILVMTLEKKIFDSEVFHVSFVTNYIFLSIDAHIILLLMFK